MDKLQLRKEIERLLQFSEKHKLIEATDLIPSRNTLLDLLTIDEPFNGDIDDENLETPVPILENLLDYAYENGIISDNTVTARDLFDTKIMGLLMPRQSEIIKEFNNIKDKDGIRKATDYYYSISQASNYIRMDRIKKNLYWLSKTQFGDLEITINLSKPEKDPKEIAKAKLKAQSNYPKCLLCIENVGFAGHINHPARQNHRVIPLKLNNEPWDFQYSPYVYYNEHCIVFNEKHVPMKLTKETFIRLFDFSTLFPHYFIGSNADLPIVGGSILTHDHFQGGRHVFPMEVAERKAEFKLPGNSNVKAAILNWPVSTLRISSLDKDTLIELSHDILEKWREYNDKEAEILAFSEIDGVQTPHNTITPIARKNSQGEFEIDLVLRNNRTSEEHPLGIFHPHSELHHIKKENIGLIEVMGLAVLPGRLNTELSLIENILTGKHSYDKNEIANDSVLSKHSTWIDLLVSKYGTNCSKEIAKNYVQKETGEKFLNVLVDAGVYKCDENGIKHFTKFLNTIGFKKED